ncbi:transcription antitermination factor NusB [Flavobacteriaceae bacterium]|jgi:N utilization substance protein B|nr:transcription antitermination factor NusB [Flavobacteriaceae bacterium]
MINRRHIRVKVMQSVYAMIKSYDDDVLKEEKFIKHSIKRMFDLYVLLLDLLVEVQKLAVEKQEISKKKYLATKEDLSPNRKFVENKLIKKIAESSSLTLYKEAQNLDNWSKDDEYIKIIWDLLQNSDLFFEYLNSSEDSYNSDKDFVVAFFKEIIAPNVKLADYFEGENITWVDDIPFVNTWVVRSLSKQKSSNAFKLGSLYKNQDDQDFVSDLFKKVILNHHSFENDIKIHTPNWETDRIADMDMILIKMGVCEFLNFPFIPTKVSINEYIEIAKDYSSDKSGYFVNGVLDKLSREFLKDKKIVKVGRGLL